MSEDKGQNDFPIWLCLELKPVFSTKPRCFLLKLWLIFYFILKNLLIKFIGVTLVNKII